jgi:hypothetical protein
MGRVLIAGVVGGLIVFAWGFVSHMMLGLGSVGISGAPEEGLTIAALERSGLESGIYVFPWADWESGSEEELEAWAERHQAGPRGFVVYGAGPGPSPIGPRKLGTQGLSDILAACFAAIVAMQVSGGFRARWGAVMAMGVFAWLVVSVPQWNWYGFPASFTGAALVVTAVGWALGGLAVALLARPADGS